VILARWGSEALAPANHYRSPMIRRLTTRPLLPLSLAAPVVAFGVAAWQRRWMSDDGYIYLRVVDQVLAGNGPVFNRGERVEAATSPLWLWLISALASVFRGIPTSWIAVGLGMLLSLAGLAFAQWGAYRLWERGKHRAIVPLGSIVIVALPPFWDFATSGLETGLAFAWLGASFWGLVRVFRNEDRTRRALWLPLLIGLAPLVRPDFVLFALPFFVAYCVLRGSTRPRDIALAAAAAIALPVAYEVFRMGYYAALVPNPALAKEASTANWAQGWHYLGDLVRPYWLFAPLLLACVLPLPTWLRNRDRRATAVFAAPIAGALAHGLYVVYIGGDFMHARMLLPAIFALAMPVSVVAIERPLALLPPLGVLVWAIVCAAALRPSYDGIGPHGISNERAYYASVAHHGHPVTLQDYDEYLGAVMASMDRLTLLRGELLLDDRRPKLRLRSDVSSYAVVQAASIGIYGFIYGTDVYVVDLHGLADPIAGRLKVKGHGRPGHEKLLPEGWVVGRFADLDLLPPTGGPEQIAAGSARHALMCGDIRRLIVAVDSPMNAGRFAHNLVDAFRLHRLRIPEDPSTAEDDFCPD
jgi:arabinofuranosyltransferase